ncbi:hypothetical protein E4T56_gene7664 [Termitomyces sp. T112]|nr:hypothetical protein E4T56_gene7664 [Termitomyces sp. T112]
MSMLAPVCRRNSNVKPEQAIKNRKRAERFRILIIGRANSGKTTILKRVCNSTEDPEILDGTQQPIDPSILKPAASRGLHEIENEMIFKKELSRVKNFIKNRAHGIHLKDRIHVIWYCIPLNDSRPVTKAEIEFFSECGTGHVPVVVLFTKFDAFDDRAFQLLQREKGYDDPNPYVPERAQQLFEEMRSKLPIFNFKYKPKGYVALRDMDKANADCSRLLEVTAEALDDDTLQLLFVATQQITLKLCTTHAIEKLILRMESVNKLSIKQVESLILRWYPHILREFREKYVITVNNSNYTKMILLSQIQLTNYRYLDGEIFVKLILNILLNLLNTSIENTGMVCCALYAAIFDNNYLFLQRIGSLQNIQNDQIIQETLVKLMDNMEALVGHQIVQLAISLAIVAEHSFFLKQENHQMSFKESIEAALDVYLKSQNFPAVMSCVKALDLSSFGRKRSPSVSFLLPPEKSTEEKKAQLHLRDNLVKIVLENSITPISQEEIKL